MKQNLKQTMKPNAVSNSDACLNHSLLSMITMADLATLCNAMCGILSMILSYSGNFALASLFLLVAVFWDFIDGKIARLFNSKGRLGKDLDSLADVISFGAAPAIFAYCYSFHAIWKIIILLFFVCCGILRLARFNVLGVTYFVGVPITLNGVWVPLVFWVGWLAQAWSPFLFLISGLLMASSLRVPKFL